MASDWILAGIVARKVGVTRRTVVNWCKSGILAGAKLGSRWFVKRSSYDAMLADAERLANDRANEGGDTGGEDPT